jgi:polysaccharide biosynthesis/export protein
MIKRNEVLTAVTAKFPVALGFVMLSLIAASCVTNKKLTYLQSEGTPTDTTISVTPADYKVLPFDNLFIKVVTPDPKLSEMFNTTPITSGGLSLSEQSADLISYPVDKDGNISLPYAGKIPVAGKTLRVIAGEVEASLKNYIADPAVAVKMINNYVSLLGEVQRPGKYAIYKDRLNIFQALAMGGDLGNYSDRQKIQIIRPTSKGNLVKEFSLSDRSILTSEFFYVMPNDVLYAKPMKGKFFHMDQFPYALIISTITTGILLYNVVK